MVGKWAVMTRDTGVLRTVAFHAFSFISLNMKQHQRGASPIFNDKVGCMGFWKPGDGVDGHCGRICKEISVAVKHARSGHVLG